MATKQSMSKRGAGRPPDSAAAKGSADATLRSRSGTATLVPDAELHEMDPYAKAKMLASFSSSQRCAFLAGFTYYELCRHGFYGPGEGLSIAYAISCAGTFVFSLLTVSVASLFSRYLTTLSSPAAQRAFTVAAHNWGGQSTLWFNLLAYISFAIAQMFIGETYYPTSCGSALATCQYMRTAMNDSKISCMNTTAIARAGCKSTDYRILPCTGGLLLLLSILVSGLITLHQFRRSGGMVLNSFGVLTTWGRNSPRKRSRNNGTSGKNNDSNPDLTIQLLRNESGSNVLNRSAEPKARSSLGPQQLQKAARRIADQALFVASFSLAAQTRLLSNVHSSSDSATFVYILMMTSATCLSSAATFSMSICDTFITLVCESGVHDEQHQRRFTDAVSRLIKFYAILFSVACICFLCGFALIAYGVGFSDGSRAGYPDMTYCPIIGSISCLVVLGVVLWFIMRTAKGISRDAQAGGDASLRAETASARLSPQQERSRYIGCTRCKGCSSQQHASYKVFMTQMNSIGSQITLCAGFVFYNMITFRTDIIDLVYFTRCKAGGYCGTAHRPEFCDAAAIAAGSLCNIPLKPWVEPFLQVVCGSFCLGFSTVLIAMVINLVGEFYFTSNQQREAFAERMSILSSATLFSYQVALCLFLVVHAMYGLVKMNPFHIEPALSSLLSLLSLLAARIYVDRSYSKAASIHQAASSSMLPAEDDHPFICELRNELDSWPSSALFFGSFAYFAVMFFYGPNRRLSTPYLYAMGLSFGASITIKTTVSLIQIRLVSLMSERAKLAFSKDMRPLMKLLYAMYVASIMSFFVGFCLIGYVKPGFAIRYPPRFAPATVIAGGITMIAIVYSSMFNARRLVSAREVFRLFSERGRLRNASYEAWRRLQIQSNSSVQKQAVFVAGNSFFEVLFTDLNVSNTDFTLASWGYLAGNSLATCCGGLVLFMTMQENRALADDKHYLYHNRLVFKLFICATYMWVFTLLCLDKCKFNGDLWGVTFYWGVVGMLILILALYVLRAIRTTARIILESKGIASVDRMLVRRSRVQDTDMLGDEHNL